MLARLFNLIEGSLYRVPLALLEAMEGDEKKSWDLGYHHAKRGRRFDASGAVDQDAYKAGYVSAKQEAKRQPAAGGRSRKQQKSYDIGFEHGRMGWSEAPGSAAHAEHYQAGHAAGRAQERPKAPPPQPRAYQPGEARASTGGLFGRMGGVWPDKYSTEYQQARDPKNQTGSPGMAAAVRATKARMAAGGKDVGEYIGRGNHSVVHHGPQLSDGTQTIYKFEKGDDEARLAKHYLDNPELGRIRSLPRYLSVSNYGTSHEPAGKPIHVIHSEHLDDLSGHPLRVHANRVATAAGRIGRKIQDAAEGEDYELKGKTREELAEIVGQAVDAAGAAARQEISDDGTYAPINQFVNDIKSMATMGIFPCDVSGENLGTRRATGEIVMRDAGCYGLA